MHISVLGPIEVTDAAGPLPLVGHRQRALLAVLALEAGRVVPVHRLVDAIWDDSPPATARAKVQAHVCALRQVIGQRAQDPAGPLLTCPPGYLLRLRDGELDLTEFGSLTARAVNASRLGQPDAASELLTCALALWRGEVCADVASPLVRAAADALEERRLLAIEAKAEADMALGRCDAVAADLAAYVARYPLRERLRAMLMLAWYRLGCRANALTAYRDGRQAMIAGLGLEPGPQLRHLHQRILADDPSLQVSAPKRFKVTIGAQAQ
ncbi:MAG TPA: AfsR/SARP family transcriptional regulator [Streptosporangiaceae bacterium]|nr:AfsR/SARP family transcriptional regulator [Streptosporangiaceae bacterium]